MSAHTVGREAESARVAELAARAAAGNGASLLVEGEPGIGKTTLLDTVAAECARLGMRVVRGAAEDLEQRLPFAAIGTCLGLRSGTKQDATTARVAGLLRGEDALGQSVAAVNHEFAATEAILDLMDQWCAAGPVALIVDDAQWADPSSVLVLHRLGQGIGQQPLLMVIAVRSAPRDEPVAGLIRGLQARGSEVLRLEPLPDAAVAALVREILAAPPGEALAGLVARAGGNPMYVTELVDALNRAAAITVDGGVADVAGREPQALPASLVESVLRRLDFLPRNARDTLEMAAVLGPTVDVTELSRVLDSPLGAVSEALVQAMEAGLLIDNGRQFVFRHDLIREALAEHLPAAVRTALRLRAGEVLAAAGAPVERVAEHLLAGTAVDPGTVDWLLSQSDALIVRAPRLAVPLLRRALAAVDSGAPAADALRLHLVRALLWDGDPVEAERAARAAMLTNGDPALHWLLLQACYRQGRLDEAVTVAEEALRLPDLAPGQAGRFHGFAATCLFYLERFDAGELAARLAVEEGEADRNTQAIGLGYLGLSALRFADGDMAGAYAHNERALAAFGRGIQPDLQADPYAMRGYCLLELDRFAEADEALATAVRHNQATGGVYLALTHALRARLRFLDGRWDDALAEIETGLDGPDPLGQAVGLRALAALIAIRRGAYHQDLHALPEPGEGVGGRKYGYLTRWAQALLEESRSRPERALELLYPVWERAWGLDQRRIIYRVCADLARLATVVGDHKRAADLADTSEALAAGQPTRSLEATALLCRGLADDDPDRLLSAAGAFHQAGWPLHEGQGYESAATVLARAGRETEAREALGKALDRYAGLEAGWDADRAEARLRQAGIRRGRHGPRKRPKHGWAALTGTENRVALMVAEGRSNPDIAAQMFLSRRTVQTHVSSILAKLSLSSRVELAISMSRREA
ncbi:ATP-binding protein [Phytohabitans rumicis]|uniref:LuxR family transcriptional regulator n=1 Tax=Phytohabitans rumicis TaxID=1076125 RepID=A0A6V8L8M7_9ACTN|nr:LuxR family transcriptional regulator [Phytohabitans rumicis]GFJ89055.1 LuxR family transcriptional regulator [Phytohabitans rumicis]